jgi:hypothetical protein
VDGNGARLPSLHRPRHGRVVGPSPLARSTLPTFLPTLA